VKVKKFKFFAPFFLKIPIFGLTYISNINAQCPPRAQDPKYWGYTPPKRVQAGEDGDREVLRDAMASAPCTAIPLGEKLRLS
jgi:hypothetical protein